MPGPGAEVIWFNQFIFNSNKILLNLLGNSLYLPVIVLEVEDLNCEKYTEPEPSMSDLVL